MQSTEIGKDHNWVIVCLCLVGWYQRNACLVLLFFVLTVAKMVLVYNRVFLRGRACMLCVKRWNLIIVVQCAASILQYLNVNFNNELFERLFYSFSLFFKVNIIFKNRRVSNLTKILISVKRLCLSYFDKKKEVWLVIYFAWLIDWVYQDETSRE